MSSTLGLNFPVLKTARETRSTTKKRNAKENENQQPINITPKYGKRSKLSSRNHASSIEEELRSLCSILDDKTSQLFCERTKEVEQLNNFLDHCLKKNESVSLHVFGGAGTGKTTTLKFLESQPNVQKKFKTVYVDCLAYRFNCVDIYKEIIQELHYNINSVKTQEDNVKVMLKAIRHQKRPILLILDEVDVIKSRNQSILYSLFELPTRFRNGEIALITVSKIRNFVEDRLPRLKSCFFVKPTTLKFLPYQDDEIINIIAKRLNKENLYKIQIESSAIQLIGKKINFTGNARSALQLAKEVIEKCVNNNVVDGTCTIKHTDVQIVVSRILGEEEKLTYLDHLSLHQKLIICSVLLIIQNPKSDRTKLTIGEIEVMYKKICTKQRIEVCHTEEFWNMFRLIKSTGIFSVTGKKEDRNTKVSINWNEDDICNAFSDKTFFGNVLNE